MKNIIIITIFVTLFTIGNRLPLHAAESHETAVSATIGEYRFTLYGYSSPGALVSIQGMGISDQTFADEEGYFAFTNRFSPFSPHEACLTAQDQFGRVSAPTCLPPFPVEYNVSIGPVLLPATVSVDQGDAYVGEDLELSGQTIPNSEVNLEVYTNENNTLGRLFQRLNPIKDTYAFSIPSVEARSDEYGNFSFTLPSSVASKYRLFTQTAFDTGISPRSVMLHVNVFPIWMVIIQFFFMLFGLLGSHLIETFIVCELLLIAGVIVFHHLHPHTLRAIILREKHELVLRETHPLSIRKRS
jgi:hypothetical protein